MFFRNIFCIEPNVGLMVNPSLNLSLVTYSQCNNSCLVYLFDNTMKNCFPFAIFETFK